MHPETRSLAESGARTGGHHAHCGLTPLSNPLVCLPEPWHKAKHPRKFPLIWGNKALPAFRRPPLTVTPLLCLPPGLDCSNGSRFYHLHSYLPGKWCSAIVCWTPILSLVPSLTTSPWAIYVAPWGLSFLICKGETVTQHTLHTILVRTVLE